VSPSALRETATLVTLGDFMACDRFDVMTRLHDVEVPTLVLGGQDDRLTPPKYARLPGQRHPRRRLVEIEAAGHFAQLEQPDASTARSAT
jgi:pimeloyl-ACP methyl ester carboxylesterase